MSLTNRWNSGGKGGNDMRLRLYQVARRLPLLLTLVSIVLLLTGCPGGKGGGY